MTDKAIRKVSRHLNKGTYLKSSAIVLFSFFCFAVFAVIPLTLIRFADFSGLREKADSLSVFLFPSFLTVLFMLLFLIEYTVISMVSMGEKAWYSGRLTKKRKCGKRLRYWFSPSRSFKAFRLNALIFLLKTFWTVCLLSPAILMISSVILISFYGGIEFLLFISMAVGGLLLLIIGLIFRFIIIQRYFLAPYLMADNPKLGVIQAVKQSKNLSEGQLLRVVKFKLKFIPAFLTYPLIFPAIIIHPDYKQGCSIVAKELYL